MPSQRYWLPTFSEKEILIFQDAACAHTSATQYPILSTVKHAVPVPFSPLQFSALRSFLLASLRAVYRACSPTLSCPFCPLCPCLRLCVCPVLVVCASASACSRMLPVCSSVGSDSRLVSVFEGCGNVHFFC
jgi:hypothetical protein